jgi:hypothetical protein
MMTARITTGLPPQCATIFDAAAPRVAALMQNKPPRPLYAISPRARTDDKRLAKAAGSGRVSPSKIRA